MRGRKALMRCRSALTLLSAAVLAGCSPQTEAARTASAEGTSNVYNFRIPDEKGGQEEFGHFEPTQNWPKPLPNHDGWTWGSGAAIYAETPDRIWIGQRGELALPKGAPAFTPLSELGTRVENRMGPNSKWHHMVFAVDREGNLVEEWLQHDQLFNHPGGRGAHNIVINPHDSEKHVWVVDDGLHVVHKFTNKGQLVMTLGKLGVASDGPDHFNGPTDIAFLPDGTFFVSDGYGDSHGAGGPVGGHRVAKFDREGKFLMEWGKAPADPKNPQPNEFVNLHSIDVSRDGRVFVLDRGHGRVQVFDQNGKFLYLWPTGVLQTNPYSLLVTEDNHLIVGDGSNGRILKYDLDGRFIYGWGEKGQKKGQFDGPHQISVDHEGNLYTAEPFNGRVQKMRRKANADPIKTLAPEYRSWSATGSRSTN